MNENEKLERDVYKEPKRKSKTLFTALTALVIVAVILLNIGISVWFNARSVYVDMTTTLVDVRHPDFSLFRLQSGFVDALKKDVFPAVDGFNEERQASGADNLKIDFTFCTDPDNIDSDEYMKIMHYTVKNLVSSYPDYFSLRYVNVNKNPSALQKYKITSSTKIYPSNIILEFGSEYRVYNPTVLLQYSDAGDEPWGYIGEQVLLSGMLALTRAVAPICCYTVNHGESIAEQTEFLKLIERSGYIVSPIDLEHDEIPENCRMMICYAPKRDFGGYDPTDPKALTEIRKLDRYLDSANSFMYFFDADTPKLDNLGEYLEEWGIKPARGLGEDGKQENGVVTDSVNKLDAEGKSVIASYVTSGIGGTVTEDMRNSPYPPKVVFPNATAIYPSSAYRKYYQPTLTGSPDSTDYHYEYFNNAISRTMFSVFNTGIDAKMQAGNEKFVSTEADPFVLMTVTSETRNVQISNSFVNDASYVCAFASTKFASNELLASDVSGNADVLAFCFRIFGREVLPADIELKGFVKTVIPDTVYEGKDPIATTAVLAILPVSLLALSGAYVTIRRKYR